MKKDWGIKKLGELGNIFSGNSINEKEKKSYMDLSKKGLFYVATKDISTNSEIEYENGILIPDECLPKFKIAHKDSVLICAEGGSAGKKLAYNSEYDICFVNKLFAFESNNSIFPKFVFYYYQSSDFAKHFKNKLAGLIGGVSLQKFKEIPCPIPPLEEQKRIVKILDEKFTQLETIKANAQTNLQNAKDLFQSQLTKAFSNTTWEKKTISEISDNLDSKRIPITKNVRKTGQYPYYGASGIVDYVEDYIFDGKYLLVSEDGANLLARTYPIAFIAEGKFWVNNHAHILSFKDEITMRFVELFFSNLDISPFVTGMAQPKFNQASLNNIEIPLPPLPEQKRIVKELDTLSEKVRQLQEIYTKQIANCANLKQSLLQKAFEGEL